MDTNICCVDGCNRDSRKLGMCGMHYDRQLRTGTTDLRKRGKGLRFIKDELLGTLETECITWPYQRISGRKKASSNGYGWVFVEKKGQIASRLVCALAHGEPPSPEYHAAHSCGKGSSGCVNPNHLSWKTKSENELDKIQHGTSNRGSRHGLSKLTEDQVLEIKSLNGKATQKHIGDLYGVSRECIREIHKGRRWGWL